MGRPPSSGNIGLLFANSYIVPLPSSQ